MVVALTALRPLLRKITNAISTSVLSSDGQPRNKTGTAIQSRQNPIYKGGSGSYWKGANKIYGRQVVATGPDLAGSEAELNTDNSNGIMMTHQVTVSSETLPGIAFRHTEEV